MRISTTGVKCSTPKEFGLAFNWKLMQQCISKLLIWFFTILFLCLLPVGKRPAFLDKTSFWKASSFNENERGPAFICVKELDNTLCHSTNLAIQPKELSNASHSRAATIYSALQTALTQNTCRSNITENFDTDSVRHCIYYDPSSVSPNAITFHQLTWCQYSPKRTHCCGNTDRSTTTLSTVFSW